MDCISFFANQKRIILLIFFLGIVGVLGVKSIQGDWFAPREPLEITQDPTLLFFNRSKGCECVLVVYQAADKQISEWPHEFLNLEIIRIDLDRQADLGRQFNMLRVPALILVDENGQTIYQQSESLSDTAPFDLVTLEQEIKEYKNGK
jgi:hypothetical protein